MVVEWVLALTGALTRSFLSNLPGFDPPAWFTDSGSLFASLFGVADSLGVWLPIGLALTIGSAVLGCLVIGFGIKLVRILLSFATAGGGSAG